MSDHNPLATVTHGHTLAEAIVDTIRELRFFGIDVYMRQLRVSAVRIFFEIGTNPVWISTVLDAVPKCELTLRDFSTRSG